MLGADPTATDPGSLIPDVTQMKPSTPNDAFLLVAVGLIAYRVGRASGAKETTPVPGIGSLLVSYFGLRAMDRIFGEMLK